MVTMPPLDDDLHGLLAKTKPKESLVMHTWHVLSRLADQLRLRPHLAAQAGNPRLWHQAYWGTFLHDFGKAADGFQKVMRREQRRFDYRHEVLSLSFVDWLFPSESIDRQPVIALIACHHRDAEAIYKQYGKNIWDEEDDDATALIQQLSPANAQLLYRWLADYGMVWAEALGFAPHIQPISLPDQAAALAMLRPKAIHDAIRTLRQYTNSLKFGTNARQATYGTLMRGLIMIADHSGSAHSDPFPSIQPSAAPVTPHPLYDHQVAAQNSPQGSALLISPTGSGKTEAALLWLLRQAQLDGAPPPRFFYSLPYQASMNAMKLRLAGIFPETSIGLQHSRALQALYHQALHSEDDPDAAARFAQQQRQLAKLHYFPINVNSPYQLLKAAYKLKGYESLLTDLHGACFVLDEIHAYEPKRLALIVMLIRFLQTYFAAKFFIMSATMPRPVRAVLQEALPNLQHIIASESTFEQFRRHRVHLLADDLLSPDNQARILADFRAGKSVLICCNTVRRAIEAYETLVPHVDPSDILLVHGRFTSTDRLRKENEIIARTAVGAVASDQASKPIVIATQVIEVSLNIDLDTLYTEAAPLEALLQRFGRVNRARGKAAPLADVYVLRDQPENVKYVYDPQLIAAALCCLESVDGQAIHEQQVNTWLDNIYTGEILAAWQRDYATHAQQFERDVLTHLSPFDSSDLEALFYQMFDGIDVLPMCFLDDHDRLLAEGKFLEASALMVSISYGQLNRLKRHSKAWSEPTIQRKYKQFLYVVDAPYTPEQGLDLTTPFIHSEAESYEAD
ncbi:MAG: CRISPR-associated helicase Cas3' [Chloroflexi bacterium CFX4]|nr:CRISPR-associated helicase Cas3' [Chloroflexi bacterium CFX4]MDL1922744.1 CRISPR-associated helicase Cas3' [Chloroflexi bacterium CFX3]